MNQPARRFERVAQQKLDWLGTRAIPASPYYQPEWFEDEREAVFRASWLQVGHSCELSALGSFIRREIEVLRASILIVKGRDGELRAFHNVCTHRGTQLVEAEAGRQTTFSCPYHMWTYGLDGGLLSAPDFEAFHVSKADCALRQVALEVVGGLIFVHFGRPSTSLRAELGPFADTLDAMPVSRATTFSEYVYDIDANWKLAYDNFQENYHLRFIHPAAAAPACAPENPFGYPSHLGFHGEHRTQRIWENPELPPLPPVQTLAFGRAGRAAAVRGLLPTETGKDYLALFPNFFLFGAPLQHFSHVVMPLAANRSRGVIRLYWVGEPANASERLGREYALASARDVHAEDRAVIERGQRGLESGALSHIHFQSAEALCRHLFNVVEARVLAHRGAVAAP